MMPQLTAWAMFGVATGFTLGVALSNLPLGIGLGMLVSLIMASSDNDSGAVQ
jgi:cytochrome c biogenesis protein CcdA